MATDVLDVAIAATGLPATTAHNKHTLFPLRKRGQVGMHLS